MFDILLYDYYRTVGRDRTNRLDKLDLQCIQTQAALVVL